MQITVTANRPYKDKIGNSVSRVSAVDSDGNGWEFTTQYPERYPLSKRELVDHKLTLQKMTQKDGSERVYVREID